MHDLDSICAEGRLGHTVPVQWTCLQLTHHSPLDHERAMCRSLQPRRRGSQTRLHGRPPRLDWRLSRPRDARISLTRLSVLDERRLGLQEKVIVIEETCALSLSFMGLPYHRRIHRYLIRSYLSERRNVIGVGYVLTE